MNQNIPMMSSDEVNRCTGDGEGFGCLTTDRGALPLEAMDVDVQIDGLIASISLRQAFVNTIGDPIEATYVFPLPSRAAVTSFRMEVAGRIVEGRIEERGKARRDYDDAIARGHRAAITEEERPGVFTVRVGNIGPKERATVELVMTGPVAYDAGEATFRFPLVVPPRYIPGRPLEGPPVGDGIARDTDLVPDASRITPPVWLSGYPNPVRLALRVALSSAGLPMSDVRSSLHSVMEMEGRRRIELRPGERLNRDFILRWTLGATESSRTSLVIHDEGGESTFMLTLVPPITASKAVKPRDVVFVLDRSGSMEGWKMVAARRAVGRMLDTLGTQDRFTVLAFDDSIETPAAGTRSLLRGTDRERFQTLEWLASIDSRAGTEMAAPLEAAADLLAGGYEDRERAIVLVTDGQIGNEDQIVGMLSPRLRSVRVFCVGIDRSVNEGFLVRLAGIGGGMSELVESEERLDEVMDRIHRRIGQPVVTELEIIPAGMEIERSSIAPARLPDLYAGAPVTILGRLRASVRTAFVEVAGKTATGAPWRERVYASTSANRAITSLWARARLRDLEDRYIVSRDPNLERTIIDTSLRHSVLCRFTAFIAVDHREPTFPTRGGRLQRVIQPVAPPDGWAMAECMAEAPSRLRSFAGGAAKLDCMDAEDAPAPLSRSGPAKKKAKAVHRETAPIDLSEYRARAHEILRGLRRVVEGSGVASFAQGNSIRSTERSTGTRRPEELKSAMAEGDAIDAFIREVSALVADLRALGALDAILEPLADAVTRLGRDPRTYAAAIVALEDFAGPAARVAFWR